MLGGVDPPRVSREGQLRDQLRDQLALRLGRELPAERIIVRAGAVSGRLGDQRDQTLAKPDQHRPHPLGGHLGLVLVEQRVVGVGEARESVVAVGVAAGQLDVALEVREQHREVRAVLRLDPGVLGDRARPGELRAQIGGDPAGLLPIAGHHPGEVGLDRLAWWSVAPGPRADLLDQAADLVGGEHLVPDPGEGRERLRARLRARRGHHRPLVPGEQRSGSAQIVDLAEPIAQVFEGTHSRESRDDGPALRPVPR